MKQAQIIGRPVKVDLSFSSFLDFSRHSKRSPTSPASGRVEYTHTESRAVAHPEFHPWNIFLPRHVQASCATQRRVFPSVQLSFLPPDVSSLSSRSLSVLFSFPRLFFPLLPSAPSGSLATEFLYFPASYSLATFREPDPTGSQRS